MKKVILSTLLAATLFAASDYKYEVTPVVGYLWNKGSDGFKSTAGVDNHAVFGAQMQFNDLIPFVKPELSLLYGRTDPVGPIGTTGITTVMAGGVVDLPSLDQMTPYVKAGLGYEMQNKGDDGLLLDAGVGAKYALTDNMALKVEWLYFLKDNKDLPGRVQNSTLLAGLSYAFGENYRHVAPVVVAPVSKPAPFVAAPKPAPVVVKPAPVVVAPKAAPVVVQPAVAVAETSSTDAVCCPIDSDNDTIFDPQDECPNTPAGYKVDAKGCPTTKILHINFIFDSAKIRVSGDREAFEFSEFMKKSPAYKARIIGHTDSTGSTAYNQKLSEKRANIVKKLLIKDGIAASRLTAIGKGESDPMSSNDTEKGREENRRIVVELSKTK